MDWKLTKSIFLAAFIVINLVLIYMIYNESTEEVSRLSEQSDVLSKTNIDTSVLEDYESREMQMIVGEPADIKTEDANSADDSTNNQTTVPVDEDVAFTRDGLEEFKNNSVYKGEAYHYDEVMSESDAVVFNQMYEDYPIFSNELARLYFSEEPMTMSQGYIESIKPSDYSVKQTVRNPNVIIEELYMNEDITGNAVIESAKLGYYIILEENNQVMMRPKWQFEITDGDIERILYVDALSQTEDIIERE